MSTYEFDENAAAKADESTGRIDESGAYVGKFKLVHAIKSKANNEGIRFEFFSPGGGASSFDVYTRSENGSPFFGMNQVQAMMSILGLRGLKSSLGKYEAYDFDVGGRVEKEGEIFTELMNRPIGIVLRKEIYTKNDNSDGVRMNLVGVFHPESRLTASEIKDKKVQPERLEKLLRSLTTKDSRKTVTPEPSQPSISPGTF